MEPQVITSLIKGIVVVIVLIALIVLIMIRWRDNIRSKNYAKGIKLRKAQEAAWLAAQPPYTPKGGELKIGTQLTIDYDNPKNHGKSGCSGKTWVSDIVHSTATGKDLYVVSFEMPSFRSDDPDDTRIESTMPLSLEEIFDMWKII
jgi:hypothetical protein